MNAQTQVSILICTCNRASDLQQTLESIGRVCVPEAMPVELLVVDNASTDDTARVVRECRLPNMPVRYLHEPRRGKGYAYNNGMAAATGNVFLFTDDDVRVPQDWITGMVAPIVSNRLDGVVGGVKVAPHLERPWMMDLHRTWLASTMHFPPDDPPILIGANMAFSRSVLTKVPAYDLELGPGALGLCDDSLFSYQLKEAGFRLGTALGVVVEHHFHPSRLLGRSFLETADRLGRSTAYIDYHWNHFQPPTSRKYHLRLFLRRCLQRVKYETGIGSTVEGISEKEMHRAYQYHYYRQHLIERKRPPLYNLHGLVKSVNA